MKFFFDETGIPENILADLTKADADSEIESIFVIICSKSDPGAKILNPALKQLKKPVFGGIFPEILFRESRYSEGSLITGFPFKARVNTIEGLDSENTDFYEILKKCSSTEMKYETALIFVDAASREISSFIDAIFMNFGLEMNYIGGGAGDLSLSGKPNIISPDGVKKHTGLLVGLPVKTGVGVHHGWKSLCGPYEITESDKNLIKSINGKQSFELYQDEIRKFTGTSISRDNFARLSQSYPLGINKLGAEKVVRDLMKVGDDGSLLSVGEVPENAFVDILTGDRSTLWEAAHETLDKAARDFGDEKKRAVLFLDCISRALFLEEDFLQELSAVNVPGIPLFGALTLGEIANNKNDYLEFYNKTSVIGIF